MTEQQYTRSSDGAIVYQKIELPTVDCDIAVIENEQLSWLLEYSASSPTGAHPNKMWKRLDFQLGGWLICEYVDHPTNPNLLRTYVRRAASRQTMALVAQGVLWWLG